MATGGYEGNKNMLEKYIPEADSIVRVLGKPLNTGDGILMAQWSTELQIYVLVISSLAAFFPAIYPVVQAIL